MCKVLEQPEQYSTMADAIKAMGIAKNDRDIEEVIEDYKSGKDEFLSKDSYSNKLKDLNVLTRVRAMKRDYIQMALVKLTENFKGDFNSTSNYTEFLKKNSSLGPLCRESFQQNGYYSVEENVFIFASIFNLISVVIVFIIFKKEDILVN